MSMDSNDLSRAVCHPFAAGLVGALIGLRFAPGLVWWERMSNVLAGAMFAGYLSPAMGEMLNLTSAPMQSAMSFVLGMFGMSLAAAVFQAVREIAWADIVTRRLGGKREGDK